MTGKARAKHLRKGLISEQHCLQALKALGFVVVFHRLQHWICEVDLIAYHSEKGWFVIEVKSESLREADQAISSFQMKRLHRFVSHLTELTGESVRLALAVVSQKGRVQWHLDIC